MRAVRSICVLFVVALMSASLLAQGPRTVGPARGFHTTSAGTQSGAAGAPEFDPNWTTAGLVLLIGGAILLAGSSRRRERLAD